MNTTWTRNITLERIGDELRGQGLVRDAGAQPLDTRTVERAVKVSRSAAKVSREVTAVVEEMRRVRGREGEGWGSLVQAMEETRGRRREQQRRKREAQRRKMDELRQRIENMRRWGINERRWMRELQRLQEKVAGQEEVDRREILDEEEGARFLERL